MKRRGFFRRVVFPIVFVTGIMIVSINAYNISRHIENRILHSVLSNAGAILMFLSIWLGAVCGVAHGLANGLLLPHVMKFNLQEVPELLADIGAAMGAQTTGLNALDAGQAAVNGMLALSKRIGLSQRLRDLGVEVDTLKECSELSMSDGSIIYNPKIIMDAEEVLAVYEEAY